MDPSWMVIGVGVWLLSNIVLPLFVNSVERLFQRQIDHAVSTAVSVGVSGAVWGMHVLLVVFFLRTSLCSGHSTEVRGATHCVAAWDLPACMTA